MTATVDFLIETATNVLKVPNAALRSGRPLKCLKQSEPREKRKLRQKGPVEALKVHSRIPDPGRLAHGAVAAMAAREQAEAALETAISPCFGIWTKTES